MARLSAEESARRKKEQEEKAKKKPDISLWKPKKNQVFIERDDKIFLICSILKCEVLFLEARFHLHAISAHDISRIQCCSALWRYVFEFPRFLNSRVFQIQKIINPKIRW